MLLSVVSLNVLRLAEAARLSLLRVAESQVHVAHSGRKTPTKCSCSSPLVVNTKKTVFSV